MDVVGRANGRAPQRVGVGDRELGDYDRAVVSSISTRPPNAFSAGSGE